jgi:hypothetical protein
MTALAHPHQFLDLQLRFAQALAERGGRPLGETVALHTNFHRRFGLGLVNGLPASPEWAAYADRLEALDGHDDRLAWTLEVYDRSPPETPPPGRHPFGCFACDPPNAAGELRIHFANRDGDGTSPLTAAKLARRQGELRDMFTFVRGAYPGAGSVRGGSWLYNLEAYRRLFPADYVASRRRPERLLSFQGYSSWGQFLDHRGLVRAEPKDRFLARLGSLDPARIDAAFPLPALEVTAPVASFYAHFGISARDSARS